MARILPNSIAEMNDIIEVKDPLLWDLRWLYILLSIIGLILLFYLVKKIIQFFKSRVKPKPVMIKNPAEQGLEALHQLVEKNMIEKGMIRPFYFELSEIFKQYLETQFKILAMEATDLELRKMIQQLVLSDTIKEKTVLIIKVSEMAKYAKYYPTKQEIVGTVQSLREFIQESFAEVQKQKELEEAAHASKTQSV